MSGCKRLSVAKTKARVCAGTGPLLAHTLCCKLVRPEPAQRRAKHTCEQLCAQCARCWGSTFRRLAGRSSAASASASAEGPPSLCCEPSNRAASTGTPGRLDAISAAAANTPRASVPSRCGRRRSLSLAPHAATQQRQGRSCSPPRPLERGAGQGAHPARPASCPSPAAGQGRAVRPPTHARVG